MNEIVLNEPTTGEITTRLYGWIAKAGHQERCRDELIAINRLESQEREIVELKIVCETIYQEKQAMIDCHKPNLDKITALTARAEQAEASEEEAVAVIKQNVAWQKKLLEKAKEITDSLRGQPQDGEVL